MPRSEMRSAGCFAIVRSKSRTTSTTPAFRSPTSPWASASSKARIWKACAASPIRPVSTTTAGIYASHRGYEADKERLKIRSAALHDIEHGGNATAEMAAFIADRIVRRHLETMARLNIGYDLLTWEGDILRLHFWTHAFEFLKKTGAVFLQTEGKLKGCWVMRIETTIRPAGNRKRAKRAKKRSSARRSSSDPTGRSPTSARTWLTAVEVRLGRDFHYRLFTQQSNGTPLWSTSSTPSDQADAPAFGTRRGSATSSIRQSYLQKLVKQALAALGYHEQASHSVHYSHEMVALSHSTARELGYDTSADADRPFVEVSGRKGLGVKADDLIDRLTDKASQEVAKRNPDLSTDETRRIAESIAIAAVRTSWSSSRAARSSCSTSTRP